MAPVRPLPVHPALVVLAGTGPAVAVAVELRQTAAPTAVAPRTPRLRVVAAVVPTAERPALRWKPVRQRCRLCRLSPYRQQTRRQPLLRLQPTRPRLSARCAKNGWKTRTSSSVRPFLFTSSVSRAPGTASSDKEPDLR